MRLLFCKIHCPSSSSSSSSSFMCFCKPSTSPCTPGPLKLETNPHHVPSIVAADAPSENEKENENDNVGSQAETWPPPGVDGKGQNCLKSILKNAASEDKKKGKKTVQWMDSVGKQLVEIREFQPSETEDDDGEDQRNWRCACIIL